MTFNENSEIISITLNPKKNQALISFVNQNCYYLNLNNIKNLDEIPKIDLNYTIKKALFIENKDKIAIIDGKSIIILNSNNFLIINKLEGHKKDLTDMKQIYNGDFLLSASIDSTVILWDLNNYQISHIFKGHIAKINSIDVTPSRNYFLSGSDDYYIKIWDYNKYNLIKTIDEHEYPVLKIVTSSQGDHFASYSSDQKLILWNVGDFSKILEMNINNELNIENLFFIGEKYLIFYSNDEINIINLQDLKIHKIIKNNLKLILPTKLGILSVSKGNKVSLFDLEAIMESESKKETFNVFISYSIKDLEQFNIVKLVENLQKNPLIKNVIFFGGWKGYPNGDIIDFMEDNIPKFKIFIPICSQNYNDSKNCQKEKKLALYYNKKIIPIFKDIDEVSPMLKIFNGINISNLNIDQITDILNNKITDLTIN